MLLGISPLASTCLERCKSDNFGVITSVCVDLFGNFGLVSLGVVFWVWFRTFQTCVPGGVLNMHFSVITWVSHDMPTHVGSRLDCACGIKDLC